MEIIISDNPLVTVIIPSYQRAHSIVKTILSVTSQDYKNLEVIIVDDHSSDKTKDFVTGLQEKDSRIKYIYLETNVGPAGARNAGLKIARGEYIAFLDSDDEWLPGKLSDQVAILGKIPQSGVVFTDCRLIEKSTGASQRLSSVNGRFKQELDLKPIVGNDGFFVIDGPLQQSIFRKFFIVISSVLVKRTILESINGFDMKRFGTEDIDLFVRLAPYCKFIYWDIEKVVKYNDETGISTGSERWLLEHISYLKSCLSSEAYSPLLPLVKRNMERFFRYLIIEYGQLGKKEEAIVACLESIKYGLFPKVILLTFLAQLGKKIFSHVLKVNQELVRTKEHL